MAFLNSIFPSQDDWNEVRDHYGVYYSENKTDQFLGATLQVSDDVILVNLVLQSEKITKLGTPTKQCRAQR